MGVFREWCFRTWYWYVNRVDKNAEILFMNFGYSNHNDKLKLDQKDVPNRYSIQLYHHLVDGIQLENKQILEVGCGRGGGLNFVNRRFKPKSTCGLDMDKTAVKFCTKYYNIGNESFLQGDAQNLPFQDNSFDILMNVESSHRYPNMKAFLSETFRTLRPGGYMLFTDFRYDYEMSEMLDQFKSSGLKLLSQEDITANVVKALENDDERRRKLIQKLAPKFLHGLALNFAGAVGSETYEFFRTRKYVYVKYILQKENLEAKSSY
jgi:ubiquinone/menaquinone biosynthesis C-methylase UbiE